YPLDPPAIAQFLGPGNWLISKVRVSGPDRARDAVDLAAATVDAPAGVVEHAIFGEDLVDGRAPTRGVVFTEDVLKIAGQQGRYSVGHGLSPRPFPSAAFRHADLFLLLDDMGPVGHDEAAALPLSVRRDDLPDVA